MYLTCKVEEVFSSADGTHKGLVVESVAALEANDDASADNIFALDNAVVQTRSSVAGYFRAQSA